MYSLGIVPAVQVIGFDHVVLRCADIEASLAFYCDELGLEPDRVDEWRRGEAFFPSARVDPTTLIDLFPIGDGPPRADVPNVDHICLVVQPVDLDALVERFPGARRATACTVRRGSRRASTYRIPTATPSSCGATDRGRVQMLLQERAALCDTFEKYGAKRRRSARAGSRSTSPPTWSRVRPAPTRPSVS